MIGDFPAECHVSSHRTSERIRQQFRRWEDTVQLVKLVVQVRLRQRTAGKVLDVPASYVMARRVDAVVVTPQGHVSERMDERVVAVAAPGAVE